MRPYVKCSLPLVAPPNVAPMLGVNSQSALAVAGVKATADSAAIISHFFTIALLLDFAVHGGGQSSATCGGASDIPGRRAS